MEILVFRKHVGTVFFVCVVLLSIFSVITAQDIPAAEIINDEGGPVSITGDVTYTNGFFTSGVAEPLIILEDQAGFVDRNRGFDITEESQVIGKITTDFFTSPFSYTVQLPIEPAASLRDVDQDGEEDTGVMVYAIAYWTNTWGDPYLEKRDLFGGGWSTAYASTHIDPNPSAKGEVIGGTYLVYAPDDEQGFPSGFGDDGKLFTEDDPTVLLPQGYTIVNLDTEVFTFDRSRNPVVDLIEGEGAAQDDFSDLSYTEAFDAVIEMYRNKYAYTELKEIDWDAKKEEFRPRFEVAEADNDPVAYQLALRDFVWSIPDGHLSAPTDDVQFAIETGGGLGMAVREVDDGRVITNFILDGGPASEAGIELRAEIVSIDGEPIEDVISANIPWSSPFSSDHARRLQQLRYITRFPVDTVVEVEYKNPGDSESTTVELTAVAEQDSFRFSSFNRGLTGAEAPVEFNVLDDGYGYVKIYSFSDNSVLTIQLWERMIQTLNAQGIPGLVIDMRQNGGGSGFLADEMAAYFFNEELSTGNTATYDDSLGKFYADPNLESVFILPPEELRYNGEIAVLVGPNCNSACEYFTYDMTLQDRAAVVGQYPTAGLGGAQATYALPDGLQLQFSIGRALDADGNTIVEGTGVAPTVKVPVDEETLFSETDPIQDAAIAYLDEATAVDLTDGGTIAIGDTVTGDVTEGARVRYTLPFESDAIISILLTDDAGELDTYLRLYDDADNLLLDNDDAVDGAEPPNSALTELEVPGGFTLVIEVGTFEDASNGSYTLQVLDASENPEATDSP
jgi:C-terminal processing protease CtpA/Prc